jgi:hypothetical protein
VSSTSPWSFERERVIDVLHAWHGADPDAEAHRAAVNESLMDLVRSPLTAGRPDPVHEGVWELRVPGTMLVITFVPDVGTKTVWLVSIR